MLYQNKKTGEFGVPLSVLRMKYPTFSIPDNAKKIGDWTQYKKTNRPIGEYITVTEIEPVNDTQQWKKEYRKDKENIWKEMAKSIDDACALGFHEFDRFRAGYAQREEEAKAYKAANYAGEPGLLLKGFADKIGLTNKQAADLVLQQSVSLRTADQLIEDQRMRKYEINIKEDDVPTMLRKLNIILNDIKQIAAKVKS